MERDAADIANEDDLESAGFYDWATDPGEDTQGHRCGQRF